jgi:hypothetical protein
MEIKISMEQALYLLAAVITVVTAMLTLVAYSLRRTRDPFLQFYVIGVLGIAVFYWIFIAWNFGPDQIEMVKIMFVIYAGGVLITIFWRYIALYFYVRNPLKVKKPFGFNHHHTNFWPYFLLVIAWILMTIWLTLYYTYDNTNVQNRRLLFYYFAGFLFFCAICRILWHIIETAAVAKLSSDDQYSKEKIIYGVLRAVDLDHSSIFIDIGDSRRVQVAEVPEGFYELLSQLLNTKVMVETDLDDGGPYRFRNISFCP